MLEQSTMKQEVGGIAPNFQPVSPVKCISFSDTSERKKNMRWCMGKERNLPRLGNMQRVQTDDLAIVAGGPSLNKTYRKIERFKDIMSCGSSHDHVISLGIKPTMHIECDPMKTQIDNYKRTLDGFTYLLASRCHRSMFQKLRDNDVRLWHMWEQDLGKEIYKGEPAFICGATVVLAAVPIALSLGYKHFHFFGFDSSFESDEQHHAYPQHEYAQMMTARVGDATHGKDFRTTATWIGQAQQFEEMQNNWGHLFKVTIYGNSMMSEMQKYREKQLGQHK